MFLILYRNTAYAPIFQFTLYISQFFFTSVNLLCLLFRRDYCAEWKNQYYKNSPGMELQQRMRPTSPLHFTTLHLCGIPPGI